MAEDEQIIIKLNDHDHEIKSLKHRIEGVEKNQDSINKLTVSVNELAINMKYMVEEQKKQGNRLSVLEKEPGDNAKYYKRLALGTICTSVIGAIIGALIALLI